MINPKANPNKSSFSGYYEWLIANGRSKATARAYFLEVSRCIPIGEKPDDPCKLDSLAEHYINDKALSQATRSRRYQAILLFSRYSGFSLSIGRPLSEKSPTFSRKLQPPLPGNQLLSDKLPSSEAFDSVIAGTHNKGSKSVLSLTLAKKPRRRWRLTGLRNRAMTLLAVICKVKNSTLIELTIDSIVIDGRKAILTTSLNSMILPNIIRTAVLEYLVVRYERRFESSFLFTNSRGGPLSVRTAQYSVSRYLKDCGNSDSITTAGKAREKYEELVRGNITSGFLKKLGA